MNIEEIEVINLRYEIPPEQRTSYAGGQLTGRLTSLVRVTASDGKVGWGSAYSHPELVRIVIEDHLKPLLLGDDPREVEALWSKMYQATRWYGRKGAALSALGALDIAFWDLRGKALGKTVQELLGGARERVPAYASALLWTDSLESLGREAAGYVDQGYRRVKMRLGKDETWSDALALTANMHVIAALPNGITVEVDRTGNPFIDDLLLEPHRIEDGCFRLPKAPGLGVDLNEAVIRRWTMPAGQRLPTGAYSDMSFGKEYWVFREPY